MALTAKQRIFIKEYLVDKNATRAAISAGYSEKTAKSIGQENLTKPYIAEAIQEAIDQQAARLDLKADTIIRELLRIATADVGQAFDEMGQLKPLSEIPEDVRRAISGLEVHEIFDGQGEQKTAIGLAKKVKFWDKPKALETLCKHMGLLKEKVEVTGKDGGPQVIITIPEKNEHDPH